MLTAIFYLTFPASDRKVGNTIYLSDKLPCSFFRPGNINYIKCLGFSATISNCSKQTISVTSYGGCRNSDSLNRGHCDYKSIFPRGSKNRISGYNTTKFAKEGDRVTKIIIFFSKIRTSYTYLKYVNLIFLIQF